MGEQVDQVVLEGVGALELVALGLHLGASGCQVGGFADDEQQRQQRGRGQQQRSVAESLAGRQWQQADRRQWQRQQHFRPLGARIDRRAVEPGGEVPQRLAAEGEDDGEHDPVGNDRHDQRAQVRRGERQHQVACAGHDPRTTRTAKEIDQDRRVRERGQRGEAEAGVDGHGRQQHQRRAKPIRRQPNGQQQTDDQGQRHRRVDRVGARLCARQGEDRGQRGQPNARRCRRSPSRGGARRTSTRAENCDAVRSSIDVAAAF